MYHRRDGVGSSDLLLTLDNFWCIIGGVMRNIIVFFVCFAAVLSLSALALPSPVEALGEGGIWGGIGASRGDGVPSSLTDGNGSLITRIINFLLYLIAVISVVMLIVGGFRYVISGGQKEAVTAAKNTILYAIVGLLVAIFAYPIVVFVVNAVMGNSSGTDL